MKEARVASKLLIFAVVISTLHSCKTSTDPVGGSPQLLIDHHGVKLSLLLPHQVKNAKQHLHIAYGHTSHGSQLITGMQGLINFRGILYAFNSGGSDTSLDLRDRPFSGASDLGNPNRTAWADATRNYLDLNSDINVIIWSWCGQVTSATEQDIETYLNLMNDLEEEYPRVKFVYMTGHLDGTGADANLNQRNEQIRRFCSKNNKILYDFADIESYDPDGQVNYMTLLADDQCNYDSNDDGTQDANWAIDWQDSHTEGVDWYNCSSAHSQPLNANLKAYAAWMLWVELGELY